MTLEELKKVTAVPAVISDRDGLISWVNASFESFFGWKSKEIMGRPLTVLIPKNLHDAHHLGFSRFLLTEQGTLLNKPLKLKAVTKAGKETDCEHLIIAEKQDGKWVFGATLTPLE
ncbi:MAG: PAS domain-containing protein [Candidatus Omnitrophica bacterium]|nr:PAS domain-containing protein [Candidatus Omnitrophota bacterium]